SYPGLSKTVPSRRRMGAFSARFEIEAYECPWVRRKPIVEDTVIFGRLNFLSFALACLMPALSRSTIRLLSNSATAEVTVKSTTGQFRPRSAARRAGLFQIRLRYPIYGS